MLSRELDRTLERVDFLEHQLRTISFIVTTAPGIPAHTREWLLGVLSAETYIEIETKGDT